MEALPIASPGTLAVTLAEYAKVMSDTGDRKAAEGLYLRSIAIANTLLGHNPLFLSRVLGTYAELIRLGAWEENPKLESW